MNPRTRKVVIAGPVGDLECAVDAPEPHDSGVASIGSVLLCHPHPLHGGTMDNKVVQTLARAFVQLGWQVVRFNCRGVGASAGSWAQGVGEIDDALAVLQAFDAPGRSWAVGGFSFGGYLASQVAQHLLAAQRSARHLVLVGPAVVNFPMASVPACTLVVHGQRDDVVPLDAVLAWAQSQLLPVTVVPGTGHFFHGQLNLLKQIVAQHCRA
jgi:uncharacterized protein